MECSALIFLSFSVVSYSWLRCNVNLYIDGKLQRQVNVIAIDTDLTK